LTATTTSAHDLRTLIENMASSTAGDPFVNVIPYIYLIRYAYFAYKNRDGGAFRSLLECGELRDHELTKSKTKLSSSNVHLAFRDDKLVIAFRGTDLPMDAETVLTPDRYPGFGYNLATDLSYCAKPIPWLPDNEAHAHEGFLADFEGLKDRLRNRILERCGDVSPRNIELCGHSLGGALATLCALWCAMEWENADITCLTIGSPRVGDDAFAARFQEEFYRAGATRKCFRLFFAHDWVTMVPNGVTERLPIPRLSPSAQLRVSFVPFWRASRWTHVGEGIELERGLTGQWFADWPFGAHFPSVYLETATRMRDARSGRLSANRPLGLLRSGGTSSGGIGSVGTGTITDGTDVLHWKSGRRRHSVG
jgi:hypothetical protein